MPSFRDGPQDQTSDVQLHIGESRDSGFDASHRPGMTESAPIPNMTSKSKHAFATSPRNAPEALMNLPPKEGVGNAGCPWHPRPRVHLVVVERTRVTTSTRNHPASPHAMVLTVSFVLSPVTGLFLPPSPADMFCLSPVGPTQLRELDASVGASGPHDFAVRNNISRPLAVDRSQVFQLALQPLRAQNAAASTAPLPASVTIMIRPSGGVGWRQF
jgi:hypothetical protein